MNRRVPWHDPNSDAEPELRAVIRYVRSHGPSEAELAALTARVGAQLARETAGTTAPLRAPRSRAQSGRARTSRAAVRALLIASGFLVGLVAWQSSRESHEPSRPTARRATQEAERSAPTALRAVPPPHPVAPTPVAPAPAVESAPKSNTAARVLRRRAAHPQPAASPAASVAELPEDELALLFRVRRIVVADPARALELTREHMRRFPRGLFAEEREALHVEALARSGHVSEATEHYASFSQRYRRSAYHERLHALLDGNGDAGKASK